MYRAIGSIPNFAPPDARYDCRKMSGPSIKSGRKLPGTRGIPARLRNRMKQVQRRVPHERVGRVDQPDRRGEQHQVAEVLELLPERRERQKREPFDPAAGPAPTRP